MDKIDKVLSKLGVREKEKLKNILLKINNSELRGLDLKKLKGRNDVFRVRHGNMRVIFRKKDNTIKILALERRTTKTYKKS